MHSNTYRGMNNPMNTYAQTYDTRKQKFYQSYGMTSDCTIPSISRATAGSAQASSGADAVRSQSTFTSRACPSAAILSRSVFVRYCDTLETVTHAAVLRLDTVP